MTERERLEELLKRLDRATARAFLAYVEAVKSDAFIRQIERFLRNGDIEAAISAIDSHIRRFASVIGQNYALVGRETASAIELAYGARAPGIAITFNPTHPRAVANIQHQTLDLIREIGNAERESIRAAIYESFEGGRNPRAAARAYRDAVGLTNKQRGAVNNYRRLLEEGSKEALSRGLRDRRYDSLVERGAPLSQEQIDRMVGAYERKYIKYRSEVVARTESTRTLAEADEESFRQSMEEMGIMDDMLERDWKWTKDKRTRDSHSHMQVKTVRGFDKPFISGKGHALRRPGDPLAPPEEAIQCRCVVVNRIRTTRP